MDRHLELSADIIGTSEKQFLCNIKDEIVLKTGWKINFVSSDLCESVCRSTTALT